MPKPLLSILVAAKDEESRLPALFDSLRHLKIPHEVVLLDSGSSDSTFSLARRRGARARRVAWRGYSATKNAGIALCRAQWVLSLDADEALTPELASSVEAALGAGEFRAYRLCRLNHFLGRAMRHGGWYPDWQSRLFRRGAARFDGRRVHEALDAGSAPVGRLKGDLLHFSYSDIRGYFERLNRYTSLQAEELLESRGARPWAAAARMLADPPLVMLKMVALKRGFLDGAHGWVLAALSASAAFWKHAKWWQRSWEARGGRPGEPWVFAREPRD